MISLGPFRLVALCVFLATLTVGCGESQPSGDRPADPLSRDTLQPIPFPDLGRLEVSSRLQLEQMYERVEELGETNPRGPLLAKAYGELGKLFNSHMLDDAAAVCYRNAELLTPEDYRWIYYRAHLFRRAGDEAVAIRGLQRALMLMKQDVSVEPQQFVAALTWLGTLHQAGGDYAGARLMYEQAIKINPGAVAPQIGLAQVAAAEGNHPAAIEKLEALRSGLASDSPVHDSVRYQLAMSYRAVGDSARARPLLEGVDAGGGMGLTDPLLQAMHNSAINSTGLVRRGINALKRGQAGAAIELFRNALEINPDNHYAHIRLASALERTGEAEQALLHLERAAELQPGSAKVWGALSRALRRQGQAEAALAALETARRLEPDHAGLKLDYAQMLLENLARPGEALVLFEQVLDIEPANVRALGGRAAALRLIEGCEASVAALEEAYASLPTSHVLADGLARTLMQCAGADRSRALALAKRAFSAKASPRYADTVARAHAAGGDFEGAVRQQEQAIELARKAGFDTGELDRVLRDLYRKGRPWQPVAGTPIGDAEGS